MLFSRPWLRVVKVAHDWGNNIIMIEGNNIIQTIVVIKRLNINMKSPKVLLCFDYHNGITNEEEDLIFARDLKLFSIGTINLPLNILNIVVVNPL